MNFPFYIAKRYLFSKKKTNLINLISAISMTGLAIGTMGLIIGLSGFNGFDSLIKSLFSSFDPDLRITVVVGKSFLPQGEEFDRIRKMPEIAYFAEIVEDNALIRHNERQVFATIKGVSKDFEQMTGIDTMLVEGEFKLNDGMYDYAVIGQSIAYDLAIGLKLVNPVNIFVPQKGRKSSLSLDGNFNRKQIYPSAFFAIQQELDSKYIIVPVSFARDLFQIPENVSAIEIKLKEGASAKKTQQTIIDILGNNYAVKNRYQQHDYLYKTMQGEKYATYLILILILVIASFNIIGSLTMLIIDKKEDIAILKSMGAGKTTIRNIFLLEGWSISILGAIVGTILGLAICQAQISFGLVKFQGGNSFIIDAYPMKIIPMDILIIFVSVVLIGFFATCFPVKQISGKLMKDDAH